MSKPILVTVDEIASCAKPGCSRCYGRGKFQVSKSTSTRACDCARKRFMKLHRGQVVLDGERRLCWGKPTEVVREQTAVPEKKDDMSHFALMVLRLDELQERREAVAASYHKKLEEALQLAEPPEVVERLSRQQGRALRPIMQRQEALAKKLAHQAAMRGLTAEEVVVLVTKKQVTGEAKVG